MVNNNPILHDPAGHQRKTPRWVFVFFAVALAFILFDLIFGYGAKAFTPIADPSAAPSAALPLGANLYGQDILSRYIHFTAVSFRFLVIIIGSILLFTYMFGSQLASITRRLRQNKLAVVGFTLLMILATFAMYADFIADYEFVVIKQDLSRTFIPPGIEHWLGTDEFGRDIFARIVHGARVSLVIGFISVGVSICIGGFLGAAAGYFGGALDNTIMRIMDIFLAVPSILLSIAIVSALGPSMANLVIALSISTVPQYARIVRASVLSVRGQEFIEAAHAVGAGNFYTIFKHIIPNVLSPVIVQGTLGVASAILSIAGLSFIGLGVQPPMPEWGSMLAGGRGFIRRASWVTTYPGVAIMISILSLNLLGDALRDALDPRLK